MRWRRVPAPKHSRIIGYQVLVERETELKALPVVTLDVMMPPTATRLRVPPGFLRPSTEYAWEVLANREEWQPDTVVLDLHDVSG